MSEHPFLSSPSDVVPAVPALLGSSPVTFWLSSHWPEQGPLVCTMRIDLNAPAEEQVRPLDIVARNGDVQLLSVAYARSLADWIDNDNESKVRVVLDNVQGFGVDLKDALLVTEDRGWSMVCTDPGANFSAPSPRAAEYRHCSPCPGFDR